VFSQEHGRHRAQIRRQRFLISVGFPGDDPKQIGSTSADGKGKKVPQRACEHATQCCAFVMPLRIEIIQRATVKNKNGQKKKRGKKNV